jgi:hypothetical protein
MSQVLVELDIPSDWRKLKLPAALDDRLQALLDKQDVEGKLTRSERSEAKAIAELSDMLSLLKLRVQKAKRSR